MISLFFSKSLSLIFSKNINLSSFFFFFKGINLSSQYHLDHTFLSLKKKKKKRKKEKPHVKSTLHIFLIHHFACIKFHFPHKTFSLYLSHSLSLSLTHTQILTFTFTFTLTLTHTTPPTPTPTRRDQPSADEPNVDKAEPNSAY